MKSFYLRLGCKRVLLNEGMPMHRNPMEKGNLYIQFEVTFPQRGFLSNEKLEVRIY